MHSQPSWSDYVMDNNDHDILIRNTALTEQTNQQVSQALQQLGRGNDRFQRIDAELISVKGRLELLEHRLPEEIARMREDMLRALGSVVNKTDENVKTALDPIQKQLTPISDALKRTHTLLKWLGATMVTLAIGAITAVVIAFILQWLALK